MFVNVRLSVNSLLISIHLTLSEVAEDMCGCKCYSINNEKGIYSVTIHAISG